MFSRNCSCGSVGIHGTQNAARRPFSKCASAALCANGVPVGWPKRTVIQLQQMKRGFYRGLCVLAGKHDLMLWRVVELLPAHLHSAIFPNLMLPRNIDSQSENDLALLPSAGVLAIPPR